MSGATSRRAALGAILAAPFATVPAKAAASVTPELARLIAKHNRINAILEDEGAGDGFPSNGTCRAAGMARARVAGFPSKGLPDIVAKAVCLMRVYGIPEAEGEIADHCERGHIYLDAMAVGIALEAARYGEGTLCA